MVNTVDIADAISIALVKKIPELKSTYINLIEKNFKRPSALIDHVATEISDATKRHVYVTERFMVTLFHESDNFDYSDTIKLMEMKSKALEIFRGGSFEVRDRDLDEPRHLKVSASSGGTFFDQGFIDIKFEFLDVRTHDKKEYDQMKELDIEIKAKTHTGGSYGITKS